MASKLKSAEITDQEKQELSSKVFPALKNRKKHPLVRFFRLSASAVMLLLCVACATVDAPRKAVPDTSAPSDDQQNLISMTIKNGITKPDEPALFELEMPESDVSLASIYKYSKEPTVLTVSQDAIDIDYENGRLVILKKDKIESNYTKCPEIYVEGDFTGIQLSGDSVLLTGKKEALIADIGRCGTIKKFPAEGKGFYLGSAGLLEFTPRHYVFSDKFKTAIYHEGDFMGYVVYGAVGSTHLLFATDSGKLALLNMRDGKFSAISSEAYRIKAIQYSADNIFVYTVDNKLIQLQPETGTGVLKKVGQMQGKDGCFFLKRSGKMFCDGYITDVDTAKKSPAPADSGLYSESMLFLKKEGVLSFVDLQEVYRQNVMLGSPALNQVCVKEGKGYFLDLDLKIKYFTAAGTEGVPEEKPASCDHVFMLKEGAVKSSDGKIIYQFGKPVNRSARAVMLKRIIGQDIYYYFEKQ